MTDTMTRPLTTGRRAGSGTAVTTHLVVYVVSGDAHPVAWAEVRADYEYPNSGVTSREVVADADGRAVVIAAHDMLPQTLAVTVHDQRTEYVVVEEMAVIVEL